MTPTMKNCTIVSLVKGWRICTRTRFCIAMSNLPTYF
jgi:hypothetical protein